MNLSNEIIEKIIAKLSQEIKIGQYELITMLKDILKSSDYETKLVDFLGFKYIEDIFILLEYRNNIINTPILCDINEIISENNTSILNHNEIYCECELNHQIAKKHNNSNKINVNIITNNLIIREKQILDLQGSIFHYQFFNAIQSDLYTVAFNTDMNYLLSAPTGTGKTDIALMSILRTLKKKNNKIIYIVPLKALATEVVKKYITIFNILYKSSNEQCSVIEFTGDTDIGTNEANEADLIVCTPEKFDLATRKLSCLIKNIGLVVIDEIHLLDDYRGPVIEIIVTRLKFLQLLTQKSIRIVGLSATIPNYYEISRFIGGKSFHYGGEYRQISLKNYIMGIKNKKSKSLSNQSEKIILNRDEIFNIKIDYIIMKIKKHISTTNNIQILIFTTSRHSTTKIANALKSRCNIDLSIEIHHAGLDRELRLKTEHAFRNRKIHILVSTTTLAWGVNLPAQIVFIFETEFYDTTRGGWHNMGILDIFQIQGRAGRLEYMNNTDLAYTYLLCNSQQLFNDYKRKLNSSYQITSKLNFNIKEAILNEICLRNIKTEEECLQWYKMTFYYITNCDCTLIDIGLKNLFDANLIYYEKQLFGSNILFSATSFGYYISYYYSTVKTFEIYLHGIPNIFNEKDCISLLVSSEIFSNISVRKEEEHELYEILHYYDSLGIVAKEELILVNEKDDFIIDNQLKCILLIYFYLYDKTKALSQTLFMDMMYIIENSKRLIEFLLCIVNEIKEYHRYIMIYRVKTKLNTNYYKPNKNQDINELIIINQKIYYFVLDIDKNNLIVVQDNEKILYLNNSSEYKHIFYYDGFEKNICIYVNDIKTKIRTIKTFNKNYKNINLVIVQQIPLFERLTLINYKIIEIIQREKITQDNFTKILIIIDKKEVLTDTITHLNILLNLYSDQLVGLEGFTSKNVVYYKPNLNIDNRIIIYKGVTINVQNHKNIYVIDFESNINLYTTL